jgi:hypothetical protein
MRAICAWPVSSRRIKLAEHGIRGNSHVPMNRKKW